MAGEIAQAIFLNNPEMIYKAYSKMLRRGNAYTFQVLADRAFGKLREVHQVDISPYKDVPTEELEQQIKRLEERLGYRKPEAPSEPAVLPPGLRIKAQLARKRRICNPPCWLNYRLIKHF